MRITHFQLGETRRRHDQSLRIYVTRRPQRGVKKEDWKRNGRYDTWFPFLAPSAKLLTRYKKKDFEDKNVIARFYNEYRRELFSTAEKRGAIDLLRSLSKRYPISIGCYCADPARCHRSELVRVLNQKE